jgi:hypothetical protein
MSLTTRIRDQWRHWRTTQKLTEHEQLLDLLRQEYLEESQDVLRLVCHAERMYYPQFRDRLLRIAAEEQVHVDGSVGNCSRAGKMFQSWHTRYPSARTVGNVSRWTWKENDTAAIICYESCGWPNDWTLTLLPGCSRCDTRSGVITTNC